jgi:hypothetical protein
MTPSREAITAARKPSSRLTLKKARTNSGFAKNAQYQVRLNCVGGNAKVGLAPNDTATTIANGANKSM